MAKPLHIMPSGDRWEVIREDEFDVLADFDDRAEAIAWAEENAGEDAAVVAHREDFSIETSR
jgi:hypothetical protein